MAGRLTFLWLVLVIGALVGGAAFLASQDRRTGAEVPAYSVRRTDATGSAAAYRLLQATGFRPAIWDRDLTHLRQPGLLVFLAPTPAVRILNDAITTGTRGEFLPHEIKALDEWVRQGNIAVVMSREPNDLYLSLGLVADEPKGVSGTVATPVQPSLLANGVAELATQTQFGFKFGRPKQKNALTGEEEAPDETPSSVPAIPAAAWATLFAKMDQSRSVPQVVSAVRGKGLYVAVDDVFPAGNIGIAEKDDAQFMVNLARLAPRGGTIWFDEYHKRDVDQGLIAYFRDRSLIPAVIYGMLLLGLLFWRTGSPFGDPQPLPGTGPEGGPGGGRTYVRAAAALYQNAGMAREAVSTIFADFRKRLTGALRMDGLANLDEVARRYEARTGHPGREAREVLILTEAALARPRLTEAEALRICSGLTQLDEQLHAPTGTRGKKRS